MSSLKNLVLRSLVEQPVAESPKIREIVKSPVEVTPIKDKQEHKRTTSVDVEPELRTRKASTDKTEKKKLLSPKEMSMKLMSTDTDPVSLPKLQTNSRVTELPKLHSNMIVEEQDARVVEMGVASDKKARERRRRKKGSDDSSDDESPGSRMIQKKSLSPIRK
jgi:hypothetical protein